MELVWTVLPFLAFLACPLMMLVCMRGMGKAGHGAARMGDSPAASGLPSERVAALQQQLQTIQAELAMLKAADPRRRKTRLRLTRTASLPSPRSEWSSQSDW